MRRVNDVARHTLPRLEAMRWNDSRGVIRR